MQHYRTLVTSVPELLKAARKGGLKQLPKDPDDIDHIKVGCSTMEDWQVSTEEVIIVEKYEEDKI